MKVLFLGCHCDDIELGCGGTIFKNKEKWEITCVNLSKKSINEIDLQKISLQSLEKLGSKNTFHYDLSPSKMNHQEIWEIIKPYNSDMVFTQEPDEHQDHKNLYEATLRAFKENTSIISYQASPWSCPFFNANYWEELSSDHLKAKIESIKMYEPVYSNKKYMSKKAIESQASSNAIFIAKEYAECFRIVKLIK